MHAYILKANSKVPKIDSGNYLFFSHLLQIPPKATPITKMLVSQKKVTSSRYCCATCFFPLINKISRET